MTIASDIINNGYDGDLYDHPNILYVAPESFNKRDSYYVVFKDMSCIYFDGTRAHETTVTCQQIADEEKYDNKLVRDYCREQLRDEVFEHITGR